MKLILVALMAVLLSISVTASAQAAPIGVWTDLGDPTQVKFPDQDLNRCDFRLKQLPGPAGSKRRETRYFLATEMLSHSLKFPTDYLTGVSLFFEEVIYDGIIFKKEHFFQNDIRSTYFYLELGTESRGISYSFSYYQDIGGEQIGGAYSLQPGVFRLERRCF